MLQLQPWKKNGDKWLNSVILELGVQIALKDAIYQ